MKQRYGGCNPIIIHVVWLRREVLTCNMLSTLYDLKKIWAEKIFIHIVNKP